MKNKLFVNNLCISVTSVSSFYLFVFLFVCFLSVQEEGASSSTVKIYIISPFWSDSSTVSPFLYFLHFPFGTPIGTLFVGSVSPFGPVSRCPFSHNPHKLLVVLSSTPTSPLLRSLYCLVHLVTRPKPRMGPSLPFGDLTRLIFELHDCEGQVLLRNLNSTLFLSLFLWSILRPCNWVLIFYHH